MNLNNIRSFRVLCLLAFAITIMFTELLHADATSIDVGAGTRINFPLKTFKAIRDENIVKQKYDYSCGAAALATLLTYALKDPITEVDVLRQVLTALSQEQENLRKKEGLSLLDLQRVAKSRGHRAQGFRITPDLLPKLKGPVIVFIKPRSYDHFAVFKGVQGNRVYLADPSLGNVRMPMYEFLSMWVNKQGKGIIFVAERTDRPIPKPVPLYVKGESLSRPELHSIRQTFEVGVHNISLPKLGR